MDTRNFFVMFPDPKRHDIEAVDDYELDSEVIQKLWTGNRIRTWHPEKLHITVDHGTKADLLGNPLSWLIVSSRVQKVLDKIAARQVQVLPLPIIRNGSRKRSDYSVVNVLGTLDVVAGNGKRRQKIAIDKIVLDVEKIPCAANIIRLETHPLLTVVSESLFDALADSGATGISFLKLSREAR
ncbi:MAG: hypothetical protein QM775_08720 [Pirellulales bacterium]